MAIFGKLVADKRLSILVENMRLEQIKQRKLVEDVRQLNNLWKERRPHVSKTYSEIGNNVLFTLDNEKLLTTLVAEVGLSSIMTNEDVSTMALLRAV